MHIANRCPTPSFAGGLGDWKPGGSTGGETHAEVSTAWHGPNTTSSLLLRTKLPEGGKWTVAGIWIEGALVPFTAAYVSLGCRLNVLRQPSDGTDIWAILKFFDAEGHKTGYWAQPVESAAGIQKVEKLAIPVPPGTEFIEQEFFLDAEEGKAEEAEWYLDEVQLVDGETLPAYADGSMRGYRWTGAPWKSATAVATGSLQAPARRRQRMNGVTHLRSGKTTVAEAGEAVKLEDDAKAAAPAVSVVLEALDTNEGTVVIGDKNVVAAAGTHAAPTRKGVALAAGERIVLDVSDIDIIWIDATTNGDGVSWTLLAA